ncbi:DUF2255 family protein [Streptomyces sp. NBC_01589]|uniref:DUF2255 family protein n=1 Tax=unclassified Streptomyces TaxID=2593676 RepID=UPI00386E2B46
MRDGDNLHLRACRGRSGAWFRTARATHTGHIPVGGVDRDVTFTEVDDPALAERLDGAYRTKYARYSAYVRPWSRTPPVPPHSVSPSPDTPPRRLLTAPATPS